MENRVGIDYESGEKKKIFFKWGILWTYVYGMHSQNLQLKKLLVDELKIYVESSTLRVNVGIRKFCPKESFNSTYC